MEQRSRELSFSVRNSGDAGQQGVLAGPSRDGFLGDLQLLAGEELEARLQVHDRIGGGSSARVYRGTLDGTIAVAIKVLHPHAAQREATLQEFLREAQILGRLQHKHIVRLHALAHLPPNFGGLPTRRFTWGIVTEYMEAGTLTKLVQDASKAYKEQQRVKQQLAATAAAAVGGGSVGPPERTASLRQLKNSLSLLRRRSLTPGDAVGGGAGAGAAALPSPRTRAGTVAGYGCLSPLAGGGSQPGVSSRQPSATALEVPQLPYTDREALAWCMEVALALQFLHAQTPPVVHRDVKTDNVLMAVSAPPLVAQPPSSARGATETGLAAAAAGMGSTGGGERERERGVAGVLATHGSLVRRVLSMRMAAAMASEGLASRAGSISTLARPGGGRPLTAKLCDLGLHVVLDMSRSVVTVRRRSFEASYTGDGVAVSGGALPHSTSLTRPSARNSPAGSGLGGALGPGAGSGVYMGGPGAGSGRYEVRSRRPSLMYNRGHEDLQSPYRRAISRDGDSFTRAQHGALARKASNLSHCDSPEPSGSQAAAAAAALFPPPSPPKSAPFTGAAAAAAAAAAFGTTPAMVGGISRLSSGAAANAAAAAAAVGPVGLRPGSSGAGPVRSPNTSVTGGGPGQPPKWSGSSAMGMQQGVSVSGFAAARASLDLLLQGRLSATAAVAAVSQSAASSHSGVAAAAAAAAAGGYGSHAHGHMGVGDVLSTGQVMLQLQGSHAGTSDRTSRLRPSYAGPSTTNTSELPSCLTIEAALRLANRSGGGRPSASTLPGGGGGPSSSGLAEPLSGGGTGGRVLAGRMGAGSPAASSKGGGQRVFKSNAAQVAQYLAMMEEDLQLDIASRSSSKAQAEMDPLYGPGSRPGSQSAQPRSGGNSVLLGPAGGSGGGPGTLTTSNRSLLSAGPSLVHMPAVGPAQMLQGAASTSRLSPAGKQRNSPGGFIRHPSQPGGPTTTGRLASNNSLSAAVVGAAAAALGRTGRNSSGAGMAAAAAAAGLGGGAASPSRIAGGSGGGNDAGGGADSPSRLHPVRSDTSARSAQPTVTAVVTPPAPTSARDISADPTFSVDGACSGGDGGGDAAEPPSPARAAVKPPPPASSPRRAASAAVAGPRGQLVVPVLSLEHGGPHASGAPSPSRGPNPAKSSSQPAMSVSSESSAIVVGGPSVPGRPTRTMSSGSRGSRAMSNLGNLAGGVAGAPGSSGGGPRSGAGIAVASPASPSDSVHPMDLSPPAARVVKKLSGRTMASSAATAASDSGNDGPLRQRQDSATLTVASPFVRRKHQPLEVALPAAADSLGQIVPVGEAASPPKGGSAAAGGDGAAAATAAGAGPPAVHGPSPRTHGASGASGVQHSRGSSGGLAAGDGAAAGAGAVAGGRAWVASSASASATPRTRNLSAGAAGGLGPGGASDSGGYPNAHATAAGGPRELHKVVKRLRPDGGGSFTANSPLGLPPNSPGAHGDSGGGGGAGAGGSFSYSRRSSMDAVLYHSTSSARSATAAMQAAGSGGGGGGASMLHREKLLWGRGLLTACGSGLAHSVGAVASVAYSSDPNSPVSTYTGPVGGGVGGAVAGRPGVPVRGGIGPGQHGFPPGALPGSGGGGAGAGAAGAGGGAAARTTSGGVSGTSGGNSDDRSARQQSITQRSSSVHSTNAAASGAWSDYPPGGGPPASAPGGTLSRAATGHNLRVAGGDLRPAAAGGGGGGGGPLPGGGGGALVPTALVSPMLAHVTGGGSQTSSVGPSLAARMVSESAASGTTMGGWTGRDEMPPQGEAAYALTGRAGTLLYMAPEVIRHEPYNEKVDVFSFGVVLYELFGRVLLLESYSKDELEALSGRIAQGFRHHRPDCMPAALWDIVQQCWAQNPADRPSMPLVVRQLELAMEAMAEAEAAAAAALGAHRPGSQLGDGGSAAVPGSPLAGPGTGPGSAATGTGTKERSSGRSLASHRSLVSIGSLGRRSRGISFRRRPSMPRQQPQPQAPTPGRQPPPPATAAAAFGSEYSTAASNVLNSGSALASPASRASASGPPDSPLHDAPPPPRCAPCGCIIS